MTDWNNLKHAYGDAGDLPPLLAQLSPDPAAEVWQELWSRVCHQNDVYTASFVVVPYLLAAAKRWGGLARLQPLLLAANIVFYSKRSELFAELMQHVDDAMLSRLEELGIEAVYTPGLSELHFTYLLQTLLLLRDERVWGPTLDHLVDGEFPGTCSSCGTDLLVVVGGEGFFVAIEEWMNRPQTPRMPIEPAAPDKLQGTPRWLHKVSVRCGQDNLAQRLEHVFGRSSCLSCGAAIELPIAIAAAIWPKTAER